MQSPPPFRHNCIGQILGTVVLDRGRSDYLKQCRNGDYAFLEWKRVAPIRAHAP
jgi:hypothetical protein